MMLVLPQTAEYALRAVSYIAEHQSAGPVPLPVVAAALGAPRNYLSKTLYLLGSLGVLRAERGVRGGYRLGRPPDRLRLVDIVQPFLHPTRHRCLMGRERCHDDAPCGAHAHWRELETATERFFEGLTIGDLLERDGSVPPRPAGTDRPRYSERPPVRK